MTGSGASQSPDAADAGRLAPIRTSRYSPFSSHPFTHFAVKERTLLRVLRCGVAVLLVLYAAPGCTSTDALLKPPHPRDEVNAALQRYRATITLKSGRVIERADEVHLGPEKTEYVKRQPQAVPTDQVAEIKVHVHRGRNAGSTAGMLPGLALMGSGLATAAEAEGPNEEFAAGLSILAGYVGMVAGLVVGGLVGEAAGGEETYVIYEAGKTDEDGKSSG